MIIFVKVRVGIRRIMCERMLLVGRWLVGWLIVCIVVLLGVDCVVLLIVVSWIKGIMLLILLIVTVRIVNVLDRVL